MAGGTVICEHTKENFPNYYSGNVHDLTDTEYYLLLAYEPPEPKWDQDKDLGLNDTVAQLKFENLLGRTFYNLVMFFNAIRKPLLENNVYSV